MGRKRAGLDPVVREFARQARQAFHLKRLILYGSRGRGDHIKESDYDFILVSDDFQGIPFFQRPSLVYPLWRGKAPIEPLCYTEDEFLRKAQEIGIVAEALQEGMEI